jgi:hypothetical protein
MRRPFFALAAFVLLAAHGAVARADDRSPDLTLRITSLPAGEMMRIERLERGHVTEEASPCTGDCERLLPEGKYRLSLIGAEGNKESQHDFKLREPSTLRVNDSMARSTAGLWLALSIPSFLVAGVGSFLCVGGAIFRASPEYELKSCGAAAGGAALGVLGVSVFVTDHGLFRRVALNPTGVTLAF